MAAPLATTLVTAFELVLDVAVATEVEEPRVFVATLDVATELVLTAPLLEFGA
ncbi:hypothetical protein IV79_GL000325 [Pediococcus claussenii]|nr:hypothetical protein IV79_GL000325 [Pediococcus claussenii]